MAVKLQKKDKSSWAKKVASMRLFTPWHPTPKKKTSVGYVTTVFTAYGASIYHLDSKGYCHWSLKKEHHRNPIEMHWELNLFMCSITYQLFF